MDFLKTNWNQITILVIALLIGSFNSSYATINPSPTGRAVTADSRASQNDSLKAAVQFLLKASASDFRSHQPPVAIGFRKVKVGYLVTAHGQKQYVLCGQFLSQDQKQNGQWTLFATIKTQDYEQWIGHQALSFCQNPNVKWIRMKDLSSALKNELEALP